MTLKFSNQCVVTWWCSYRTDVREDQRVGGSRLGWSLHALKERFRIAFTANGN